MIAGSEKYRGAASLALNGALASGAGSVSAFLPSSVSSALWITHPEVLLSGDLNTFQDGSSDFSKVLNEVDLNRFDSILLGPGLGIAEEKIVLEMNCRILKAYLFLMLMQ